MNIVRHRMLVGRQPAEKTDHRADVAQQVNNAAVEATGRAAIHGAHHDGQMPRALPAFNLLQAEQAVERLVDQRLKSGCEVVVSHGQ